MLTAVFCVVWQQRRLRGALRVFVARLFICHLYCSGTLWSQSSRLGVSLEGVCGGENGVLEECIMHPHSLYGVRVCTTISLYVTIASLLSSQHDPAACVPDMQQHRQPGAIAA
jgi:hypothetical protein